MVVSVMQVRVFKSSRLEGLYVYLQKDTELRVLPKALFEKLGEATEVLTFELAPDKKLAQAEAAAVIRSIKGQGYYLQMPPNLPGGFFE